jgi:hypothetical protein
MSEEQTPEEKVGTDRMRYIRILQNIVEHAERIEQGLAEEHPSATHYMRTQLNKVREQMAKDDPLVADLFPPVPEDTSISDVGVIAKQLLDFAGETITERTAKAVREGLTITGENVSVCLSDLAELGVHIRDRVTEALGSAFHPGDPKEDEELDARITELETKAKETASRISKDAEQGYEDSATLAQLAKELARLQLRKARKRMEDAVAKEKREGQDESKGDGNGNGQAPTE